MSDESGKASGRTLIQRMEDATDRVVGFFSPTAYVHRHEARLHVRRYAAATTPRSSNIFSTASGTVNDEIGSSYSTVRSRVRQLVRDFPWFTGAVNNRVAFVIGDGMTFRSRVTDEVSGEIDRKTSQLIEDEFARWSEKCDSTGRLHFNEVLQLSERQDAECGEFLAIKKMKRKAGRRVPFQLHVHENDMLSSISARAETGNDIWEGVEYDTVDGSAEAYWFEQQLAGQGLPRRGTADRVSAARIIHDFEVKRPYQLRGISYFTAAILIAADLEEYMDAEIDAHKMASKWLAFVETPDISGFQSRAGATTDSRTGKLVETIENCMIDYRKPGEKVNFAGMNRSTGGLDFFAQFVLRIVAVITGMPYEVISMDNSKVNFSSMKILRSDFRDRMKPIWGRKIRHICMPTFRDWMDVAVGCGALQLRNYWENQWHYQRNLWIPPGWESVDGLRETKSMIDQIEQCVRSPQEWIMGRGRDPQDVLTELKEWNGSLKAAGLQVEKVSTAMKNNPAALGATDNASSKKKQTASA